MARYTDAEGNEWTIELDAPTIRAVRSATCEKPDCDHHRDHCQGVDLVDVDGANNVFVRLGNVDNIELLIDTLWELCHEQANARSIDTTTFAKGLRGDALDAAGVALREAICDFFPKEKRELLKTMGQRNEQLRELAVARGIARINSEETEKMVLDELDKKVDADIKKVLTRLNSASSTPDSAESTPDA